MQVTGSLPKDPRKGAVIERDAAYGCDFRRISEAVRTTDEATDAMIVDEGAGLGLVSFYGDESGTETAIVLKAQSVEATSNSATEVLSWASWCDLHDGDGDVRG